MNTPRSDTGSEDRSPDDLDRELAELLDFELARERRRRAHDEWVEHHEHRELAHAINGIAKLGLWLGLSLGLWYLIIRGIAELIGWLR